MNLETNKKLENFVTKPEFTDMEIIVMSNKRRASHSDTLLKDLE